MCFCNMMIPENISKYFYSIKISCMQLSDQTGSGYLTSSRPQSPLYVAWFVLLKLFEAAILLSPRSKTSVSGSSAVLNILDISNPLVDISYC